MKSIFRNQKGFTLIEILLVVAAIAILAGIVIVAINPAKQLGDTSNAKRNADVLTISNAVNQYTIGNSGSLPASITSSSTEICNTAIASSSVCATAGLIDLSVLTANQTYLAAIPVETGAVGNGAGYMISKSVNGRTTVEAQHESQGAVISVTR